MQIKKTNLKTQSQNHKLQTLNLTTNWFVVVFAFLLIRLVFFSFVILWRFVVVFCDFLLWFVICRCSLSVVMSCDILQCFMIYLCFVVCHCGFLLRATICNIPVVDRAIRVIA